MIVVVLGALTAAIGTGWYATLALVGRSTYPTRERRPLRSWTRADLRANAARGVNTLAQAQHTLQPR